MRERCMGKGASMGKEDVRTDSGRMGEVAAMVGQVKSVTLSATRYALHNGQRRRSLVPACSIAANARSLSG